MKILVFTIAFLFGSTPFLLFAQDPPPEPPQSSRADVIDKEIFEGATAELVEVERKKPQIEKPPEAEKPSTEIEGKFFIREISLRGNRSIPTDELRPFLTPYEGRDLTLTDANQLAGQIEREYRRRGYLTTLAYIPPQRIENQRLTLGVVEGKVGKLHIEGNRWFSKRSIRRYWRHTEGKTLRYQDLQKRVRRMNENPDREVRVILRPGEKTGFTDIYLKVKDQFPAHGGFRFDNQGTPSTGRKRFSFTLRHNNWLIPDSIFLAGMVFGKDFGSLFLQYLIPLTPFGTKLILGFNHSQAAPKREFKGSDVHGNATTYSVTLRQALSEGERFTSAIFLGFDFKDSRTHDTSGTRRMDRLRVLRPGFDFTEYDRRGSTTLSNQFSFGLRGLGAIGENNPFAGRNGAPPDFVKYNGTLSRSLVFPFKTQMNLNLEYQISFDKLTPQDELYLGGAATVRGYPEGDYLGDQGILFNIEYLFPLFLIPKDWKLPYSKNPLRKEIQGVAFFDEAYAKLRGASSSEVKKRHLIGIGGGLRIRLLDHLFAKLEVGYALGDEPLTESDHARFHFQLQTEI